MSSGAELSGGMTDAATAAAFQVLKAGDGAFTTPATTSDARTDQVQTLGHPARSAQEQDRPVVQTPARSKVASFSPPPSVLRRTSASTASVDTASPTRVHILRPQPSMTERPIREVEQADSDRELRLAHSVVTGLVRNATPLRRTAALARLAQVEPTAELRGAFHKVIVTAIDELGGADDPRERGDALLNACSTLSGHLPHDVPSGGELFDKWVAYADTHLEPKERSDFFPSVGRIFSREEGIQLSQERIDWRTGAIVAAYNRFKSLGYTAVGELFAVSPALVSKTLKRAEDSGVPVARKRRHTVPEDTVSQPPVLDVPRAASGSANIEVSTAQVLDEEIKILEAPIADLVRRGQILDPNSAEGLDVSHQLARLREDMVYQAMLTRRDALEVSYPSSTEEKSFLPTTSGTDMLSYSGVTDRAQETEVVEPETLRMREIPLAVDPFAAELKRFPELLDDFDLHDGRLAVNPQAPVALRDMLLFGMIYNSAGTQNALSARAMLPRNSGVPVQLTVESGNGESEDKPRIHRALLIGLVGVEKTTEGSVFQGIADVKGTLLPVTITPDGAAALHPNWSPAMYRNRSDRRSPLERIYPPQTA